MKVGRDGEIIASFKIISKMVSGNKGENIPSNSGRFIIEDDCLVFATPSGKSQSTEIALLLRPAGGNTLDEGVIKSIKSMGTFAVEKSMNAHRKLNPESGINIIRLGHRSNSAMDPS